MERTLPGPGRNTDSFTDSGLSAATTYIYRVAAYNGAGSSAWSAQASATTADNSGGPLSLSVIGYKLKGVHHADLAWSGGNTTEVDIYRDQQLVATVPNNGNYTDNIGTKGGGNHTYSYDVCERATTTCSNAVLLNTALSPEAGDDTDSAIPSFTASGGAGSMSASLLLVIGLSVAGFRLMARCLNRRRLLTLAPMRGD